MDTLNTVSGEKVPNLDPNVENPDASHTVGRRQVKPIVFELSSKDQNLGLPSDEKNLQAMQVLAQQLAEKIELSFEEKGITFDRDFLQQVANLMNEEFSFTLQGSGVATLTRQLEMYQTFRQSFGFQQSSLEEKRNLRKLLDCKLATVMTALVLNNLAQRQNVVMRIDIASTTPEDPHPRLRVTLPNTENTRHYSIDFHVQLRKNELTGKIYDLNEDRDTSQEHSESVASTLEINPSILPAFDKKYPSQSLLVNTADNQIQKMVQTLHELDTRFLNA